MSYDGESESYPVVTIVLYFGCKKRWNRPLKLSDCLAIPDELRGVFSDYAIRVFEVAYLSDEQIEMFKSDFKLMRCSS